LLITFQFRPKFVLSDYAWKYLELKLKKNKKFVHLRTLFKSKINLQNQLRRKSQNLTDFLTKFIKNLEISHDAIKAEATTLLPFYYEQDGAKIDEDWAEFLCITLFIL
jgi:hypothetical protein